MKKLLVSFLAAAMLLNGCTAAPAQTTGPAPAESTAPTEVSGPQLAAQVVEIELLGNDISVNGSGVTVSRDIVYYEVRTEYESGNPYGEGEEWEMHSREEAAEHLVVNITAPGTYRVSGKLDKGQLRVDLGEGACSDPDAVVNLILDGVEITCTVGPAILFQNVYECDGNWSIDTAKPDVDTTAAGANLILAENSVNTVNGSHVAKIYKDAEGEKKLWKQDGAVYSYMSMNVYGPGALDINADNEGLDTELHLTIFGGDITIRSGNDGINTNEDGVSVTAIRDGNLRILAGLGEEGDGIDSNGYLVIYGGTVISSAHPASDAGLDSDLGSFIHGGTVVALGAAMDWAESDSGQVTMNLQFAQHQSADSSLVIAGEDGAVVFAYDPSMDEIFGENIRDYQGAIISCPLFRVGDGYEVFIGAQITGTEQGGVYDVSTVTGFAGGVQMAYTGTDVMMGPGGFGPGGQRPEGGIGIPEDRDPDDMPEPPEGDVQIPPQPSEGMNPTPQGTPPTGPQNEPPQDPPGGFGGPDTQPGVPQTLFVMQDQVNFFSGLTPAE